MSNLDTTDRESYQEQESEFLNWVAQCYGREVSDECQRVLDERGGTRSLTAEILEEALYRFHREEIDSALRLGEHCFTSG